MSDGLVAAGALVPQIIHKMRSSQSRFARVGSDINHAKDLSESIIETKFNWLMRKSLLYAEKDNSVFFNRIFAQKRIGKYRVDYFLETNEERRIIVELDGRTFHNEERDKIRDDDILSWDRADAIIRIPFAAIYYYHMATLRLLMEFDRCFCYIDNPFVVSLEEVACATAQMAEEELERFLENTADIEVFCVRTHIVGHPAGVIKKFNMPRLIYRDRNMRLDV